MRFTLQKPIIQTSSRTSRLAIVSAICATVSILAPNAFAAIDNASLDPQLVRSVINAQPTCENFVRYDASNAYFGFGAYKLGVEEPRAKIPGHVTVRPVDGSESFDLATLDSAVDITTAGTTAYILTYSGLESWNLATRSRTGVFATYDMDREMKYKEHAMALAKYENTLIIAHGRMGVSFFDLTTHKLIQDYRLIERQKPLESMAVGVTIQSHYAFVAVDNFNYNSQTRSPAFRGIVVIEMTTQKVVAELEGIDAGITSVVSDANTLIFDFGGIPLWKFDINHLGDKTLSEPKERVWALPGGIQPIGHAEMDRTYYYTCATVPPSAKGGKYTRVPMALDRKALKLD